ncbi:MAG: hypothetical protein QGH60_05005 [Phycisphaerae bacterium]|jgi:hypothetical protein|nr:hypothetical protein [Phycisphaerae bacterium]
MSGKQIIFVERASDAAKAARLAGERGDSTIIALNSNAMWALEKRNVPYRIGLDFYGLEELFDYRENLYDRVEMICARFDEILVDKLPILRDSQDEPLRLARGIFLPLKCLLNALTQNLLNILRPYLALEPQRICVHAPLPARSQESLYPDPDQFNLFYKLLRAIAEAKGIDLDVLDAPRRRGPWRKRVDAIRLLVAKVLDKSAAKLRGALGRAPAADPVSQVACDATVSSAMRVFVPKPRYSAGMLARTMACQGVGTVIGPPSASAWSEEDQQLPSQLEDTWRVIRDDPRIAELFTFEGIALLDVVAENVRTFLRIGLTEALHAYRQTRRTLTRESIDVMLASTMGNPDDLGMVLACRTEDVPVVIWQHGSYAMFDPHTQPGYYDLRDADHFFAFGEGTNRAFAAVGRKWDTQIATVGSAPLDQIASEAAATLRRAPSRRPTVLVPLRGLNIPIIGDSYQSYPQDLYWRELQQMLVTFARFPQLQFVLKLYPANTPFDNPIRDFLKTRGIKNIRLQHLRGFTTLLPEADLVVLDWPYSTLLEAVSTSVPVICYRKHWPLRHGVEEMICKRCFLADSPEQLDGFLREYADGRLPVLDDRTLLREYGTNEDNGKSITSGLLALQRICCEKNIEPLS